MDIEVEIGSLAIEGFESVDRRRFVDAFENGLRDRLAAGGVASDGPGSPRISSAPGAIDVTSTVADAGVGRQLAALVAQRLGGGSPR
jgi:hypothetical protein